MDCSTPGFPVLHYLLWFAQTHVHWVGDAIQPTHPVTPFSSCPQSFSASGSFPVNQLIASSGQTIRVWASAFPVNIQGWFPLQLTGLISLLSKGFLRVFSSIKIQKHQFFLLVMAGWANNETEHIATVRNSTSDPAHTFRRAQAALTNSPAGLQIYSYT